jgi:nitrogen-specific signal transduction histidine kinase
LTQGFGRTARFAEQGRLAAIGELASGIAHELRTPLSTVSMALESLSSLGLEDRAKRRLDLGLGETERMRRLLDDMLMYAKPLSLELRPVEVNATLSSLHRGLRLPGTQHRIRLHTDAANPWILGDIDRLRQIFVNLTDNACQAAPEGHGGDVARRGRPGAQPGADRDSQRRRAYPGAHPATPHRAFLQHPIRGHGARARHRASPGRAAWRSLAIESEPDQGTEFRLAFPRLVP